MTLRPAVCRTRRVTSKPHWRWVNLLLLFLCLLGASAPARGQEAADPAAPKPLDILLLIDSSPSSHETDPQGLRINAAKFLLDYLQATAQVLRVNYRAGVANFGGRVGDTTPLRLLEGGIVQGEIVSQTISYTDFRPPLDWALRELRARSFGVGNQMAVILFTDGNPQLTSDALTVQQKQAYFEGQPLAGDASQLSMPGLVNELREAGVAVFVVGIGEARQDARFWQQLVGADSYRSLNDVGGLSAIYHEFATRLLGAVARPVRTLQTTGSPFRESAPPYLEQIIFSLVKETPAVAATLTDPSGNVVTPTVGGRPGDLYAIYAIANPAPGDWQIGVNGSAQMWVDQRLAHLTLEAPQGPQILRQPIPIAARLVRNGQAIADPDLQIGVSVTLPGAAGVVSQATTRTDDGIFTTAFVPETAGVYTVTATARLRDQPLAVEGQRLMISAYPAPSVVRFQIKGEPAPGRTVTLLATLADANRMQDGQPVEVALLDQDGVSSGTVSLHDDGRSPDQRAGDGVFSADLIISPALQAVELVMTGRTTEGVSFSVRERYPLVETTVATATATVGVTPTPPMTLTPTATEMPPVTPAVTPPPPGDKVGIAGSDWRWLIAALALGAVIGGVAFFVWKTEPLKLRLNRAEKDLDQTTKAKGTVESELKQEQDAHEATKTQLSQEVIRLQETTTAKELLERELAREKDSKASLQSELQQEQDKHKTTEDAYQKEKDEHQKTRAEWDKSRQEWENEIKNLREEADEAFERGNKNRGIQKLEKAIEVASDAAESAESLAATNIAELLEDLLSKGFTGNTDELEKAQWQRLKKEINSDALPVRAHGVAIVLQQRWTQEPARLPSELNEVLCLQGGMSVIEKMNESLRTSSSQSARMLLGIVQGY